MKAEGWEREGWGGGLKEGGGGGLERNLFRVVSNFLSET